MVDQQYVCTVCGYNMAGYLPDNCPFCGATKDRFITSQECSARYRVIETPVTGSVSRLNSFPKLGLEHAAYRIRAGGRTYWIDCPSCFDTTLPPMDEILFTHHHFLGASNQYREYFSSSVRIHSADSRFRLCRGFTCYFFEDVFFVCDYVFADGRMRFNPYGPGAKTVEGGRRIRELLAGRDLNKVCGVDYVMDFNEWSRRFDMLLAAKR